MLRSIRDLIDYAITTAEGDIGRVTDFYFDDEKWGIRHLVVDTGGLLSGKTVLVSPLAIESVDWQDKRIRLSVTREKVENSPSAVEDQPVSRQWEENYYSYYGWPYYWVGPGLWGPWVAPMGYAGATGAAVPGAYGAQAAASSTYGARPGEAEVRARRQDGDSHLRSANEVVGYEVAALDGAAGNLEDLLIEDTTWKIEHLEVDTTRWWPGGEVLISPERADRIDWPEGRIVINLTKNEIQNRPEFRPAGKTAH